VSVTLLRHAPLEAITLKARASIDGQGKPSYGADQVLHGRVVRKDEVIRVQNGVQVNSGGDSVDVKATAWLDGAQSPVPRTSDKITLADGLIGIVVSVNIVRKIQDGTVDHVRIKLREQ
jgi:hypothetical protein